VRNWFRTIWLILAQKVRAIERDITEATMVDECNHRADDLVKLIEDDHVPDAVVKHHWLRFMAEHRRDPMFWTVIKRIITAFETKRPTVMDECCIPSTGPDSGSCQDDEGREEPQSPPLG